MPITINGSGTVTGISAGGLPDGVITTDDLASNAVTFAKIGTTEQSQLCRAWVNFDGTSNSNNLSGTYSRTGTTVTVTATAHGLIAGNEVYLDFTSGTAADGTFTVATVTDADTFTVTHGTSGSTSGNVTIRRNPIRASYNVSSITDNGTGDYTVNFTTAMADANYHVNISTQTNPANGPDAPTLHYNRTTNVQSAPTTSAFRVSVMGSANGTAYDRDYVCCAVFR